MSSLSIFECFGLVIHGFDWLRVKERWSQALTRGEQTWIVTANPEILLEAKRNAGYWQTLRQADLRIVDGIGLKIVGWFLGSNPVRLTGVDLAEHLLQEAMERGWKVAFFGGQHGEADQAAWKMRERYPSLRIVPEAGGMITPDGRGDAKTEEAIHRLIGEAPDILLVALSFPGQETWIGSHLADLPSVKIAVGVGGTFNYWAGTASRAPRILRHVGLEWFWRVIHEPRRIKRIWNAVVIFPLRVFAERIRSSDKKKPAEHSGR
jgi:N-acetylglucosaminyldiphosphoundecaprenol N-acetyl-beta-D-mannosaminyltransferase